MACRLLLITFGALGFGTTAYRGEHLATILAQGGAAGGAEGIIGTPWENLLKRKANLRNESFGRLLLYELRPPCKGEVVVKQSIGRQVSLKREIQAHSVLQHPHIVQMFDSYGENQMILEASPLGSLKSAYDTLLPKKKGMGMFSKTRNAAKANILAMALVGALRGLVFMHGQGFIHRHVKPRSIFTVALSGGSCIDTLSCHFVLGDLLLATNVGPQLKAKDACNENGCAGTVRWMPPESYQDVAPFWTFAGDVWALGMSLREMIHPMQKVSEECSNAWRGQTKCQAEQLKEILGKSHIPAELVAVVNSMVQARWDNRPTAQQALTMAESAVKKSLTKAVPKLFKGPLNGVPACIKLCAECPTPRACHAVNRKNKPVTCLD